MKTNQEKFLLIYPDCILVNGYRKMLIMDMSRKNYYEISSSYYEILCDFRKEKISSILIKYESEQENVNELISFLVNNDLATYVDSISSFPEISTEYFTNRLIRDGIIEGNDQSDKNWLRSLIVAFNNVKCESLEFVYYNKLEISDYDTLFEMLLLTELKSIILVTHYNNKISQLKYKQILEKYPFICFLYLFGSDEYKSISIRTEFGDIGNRKIVFSKQIINNHKDCGNIKIENFTLPKIEDITANKSCNSCLGNKLSIDLSGKVKNCPSFKNNFGNVGSTPLSEIVNNEDFKLYTKITKDDIETCKDCQYRYICKDCRAYIQDPKNIFSKPLKCGYDPYLDRWDNWRENPLNKDSIKYYEL